MIYSETIPAINASSLQDDSTNAAKLQPEQIRSRQLPNCASLVVYLRVADRPTEGSFTAAAAVAIAINSHRLHHRRKYYHIH